MTRDGGLRVRGVARVTVAAVAGETFHFRQIPAKSVRTLHFAGSFLFAKRVPSEKMPAKS